MGYNSKEIKTISTAKGKGDPFKGVIYDPMGQWKYPGQITRIPGGNITMAGVPYPVFGVDDLGNQQLMMPGGNYTYPGQNVTEYPMLSRGGVPGPGLTIEKAKAFLDAGEIYGHSLTTAQENKFKALLGLEEGDDIEDYEDYEDDEELDEERRGGAINHLSKRYTHQNIQSSLNYLMARNENLFGPHGHRIFLSRAQDGGDWLQKYQKAGSVIKPWNAQPVLGSLDLSTAADQDPMLNQNGIESKINRALGYPQEKSREFATRLKEDDEDQPDQPRHTSAGYETSQGIKKLTGSGLLGFLGSSALGAAHELSTLKDDNRPWGVKLREGIEDQYNNMYGAGLSLKGADKTEAEDIIANRFFNNEGPDGYGEGNMYIAHKENDPNKKFHSPYNKTKTKPKPKPQMRDGGWLDQYQTGSQVSKNFLAGEAAYAKSIGDIASKNYTLDPNIPDSINPEYINASQKPSTHNAPIPSFLTAPTMPLIYPSTVQNVSSLDVAKPTPWMNKYAEGGPKKKQIPDFVTSDKEEYNRRLQAYNDSLGLYNYSTIQNQEKGFERYDTPDIDVIIPISERKNIIPDRKKNLADDVKRLKKNAELVKSGLYGNDTRQSANVLEEINAAKNKAANINKYDATDVKLWNMGDNMIKQSSNVYWKNAGESPDIFHKNIKPYNSYMAAKEHAINYECRTNPKQKVVYKEPEPVVQEQQVMPQPIVNPQAKPEMRPIQGQSGMYSIWQDGKRINIGMRKATAEDWLNKFENGGGWLEQYQGGGSTTADKLYFLEQQSNQLKQQQAIQDEKKREWIEDKLYFINNEIAKQQSTKPTVTQVPVVKAPVVQTPIPQQSTQAPINPLIQPIVQPINQVNDFERTALPVPASYTPSFKMVNGRKVSVAPPTVPVNTTPNFIPYLDNIPDYLHPNVQNYGEHLMVPGYTAPATGQSGSTAFTDTISNTIKGYGNIPNSYQSTIDVPSYLPQKDIIMNWHKQEEKLKAVPESHPDLRYQPIEESRAAIKEGASHLKKIAPPTRVMAAAPEYQWSNPFISDQLQVPGYTTDRGPIQSNNPKNLADDVLDLYEMGKNKITRMDKLNQEVNMDPVTEYKPFKDIAGSDYHFKQPIAVGDTIWEADKNKYYLPEVIDLNKVKFATRDRGDTTPINTEGAPIATFDRWLPKSTFTKVNPNDSFIGVDSEGHMKGGNFKDFGSDDKITKSFSNRVVDFVRDKKGDISFGLHSPDNPGMLTPEVWVINDQGKKVRGSLPLLTYKGKADENAFGHITGGHMILQAGNEKVAVSGSVKDLERAFNKLKAKYGEVTIFTEDNGTYNVPLRTKDKILTSKQLAAYDRLNASGGNFAYITGVEPEVTHNFPETRIKMPNIRTVNDESYKKGHPLHNELKAVVFHHTAYNDKSLDNVTKQYLKPHNNSSHVVIGYDGERRVFAEPTDVTFHSGESKFLGRDNVNDFALGIEFQGTTGYLPGQKQLAKPQNLTDAQVESAVEYLAPLVKKYKIPLESLTTHARISPGRKPDISEEAFEKIKKRLLEIVYEENDTKRPVYKGVPFKLTEEQQQQDFQGTVPEIAYQVPRKVEKNKSETSTWLEKYKD